jgi:DNA-binding ferritin-like protein
MDLTNLQTVLEETFAANFVSYYRSHVAHVNLKARTFYQDHKLLQKIYEYFQGNIDTIAEKLRTTRAYMPADLMTVTAVSPIVDMPATGTADELLEQVLESLEAMIDQYHALYDAAEEVNYIDISNFAQDQIGQIARFRWMIESTLEERDDEEE